jgi:hypothetical protein
MWSVIAAPMLLSQNVRNLTKFRLETYLNSEVIAVSQDPLGRPGQKIWGGDLAENLNSNDPPLTLQNCGGYPDQTWKWNVSAPFFLSNSESNLCANVDDCGTKLIGYTCVTSGGTCAGNFIFPSPLSSLLPSPLSPLPSPLSFPLVFLLLIF